MRTHLLSVLMSVQPQSYSESLFLCQWVTHAESGSAKLEDTSRLTSCFVIKIFKPLKNLFSIVTMLNNKSFEQHPSGPPSPSPLDIFLLLLLFISSIFLRAHMSGIMQYLSLNVQVTLLICFQDLVLSGITSLPHYCLPKKKMCINFIKKQKF